MTGIATGYPMQPALRAVYERSGSRLTPAEAAEPPMLAPFGGSLWAKGQSVSAMKKPRRQPHLSLLVTAPLHHHDRPAAGLHAAVETPLTDPLRAALGACLRARGPLL